MGEFVAEAQGVSIVRSRSLSSMIALLGRRDEPTDALEDYCHCLGQALAAEGYALDLVRVPWPERGWLPALNWLRHESEKWKGSWVLVQYTALSWSRRGFPLLLLAVLGLLRIQGTRIAVIFHDPEPYPGTRLVDKVRRSCQRWIMRWIYKLSDKSVLTIPVQHASWLPANCSKATFVPVGANIPAVVTPGPGGRNGCELRTIAVFGVTGDGKVGNEVSDIALVAKTAAKLLPGIRLVTIGRGSLESEAEFRVALQGSKVDYRALGILSAEDVGRALSGSDISLFVRGPLSTQRGSAIASIACAVPLAAYVGQNLAAPFSEAGVVTVACGDCEGLAEATVKILTDRALWLELHYRSKRAYEKYFAWDAVAGRFLELFDNA